MGYADTIRSSHQFFKDVVKNTSECCSSHPTKRGSDNKKELSRINRIKGQVEGVSRMIQEQAYCPSILTQIQAVRSALASLQASILANHLEHCVRDGLKKGGSTEADQLVNELVSLFKQSN